MANGIITQQTRDDRQLPKHRKTSTTSIKKSLRSLKSKLLHVLEQEAMLSVIEQILSNTATIVDAESKNYPRDIW